MKIQVPEKAKKIIDTLNAAGYEAYAVGGCVRDSVLGRDIHVSGCGLPAHFLPCRERKECGGLPDDFLSIGKCFPTVIIQITQVHIDPCAKCFYGEAVHPQVPVSIDIAS